MTVWLRCSEVVCVRQLFRSKFALALRAVKVWPSYLRMTCFPGFPEKIIAVMHIDFSALVGQGQLSTPCTCLCFTAALWSVTVTNAPSGHLYQQPVHRGRNRVPGTLSRSLAEIARVIISIVPKTLELNRNVY